MKTTLVNPTNQVIKPFARLNTKWYDGLNPGCELETDDPYVIAALLKAGCVLSELVTPVKEVRRKRGRKQKEDI